jgi:hypothetical protein
MTTLPFGKHKDKPLGGVPTGYLQWLLGNCKLSSGLRADVAGELARRGLAAPAPPPSPREPACPRCGSRAMSYGWYQDRLNRRQIRRTCRRCCKPLGFAPQVAPYIGLANAAASAAPVLDVLLWCQELDIALKSDGLVADFATREDYLRAEPALRLKVAECRASLGRMLGKRPGVVS